jgi:Protein of unknown function (DUF4013)
MGSNSLACQLVLCSTWEIQNMMLSQALRYPFRGKESFRFLLILTLMQLLPLVGQLILLGYGLDVVRAVSAGHTDLPSLRWLPALEDGLRILIAGFVYLLPILVTIAIVGVSSIRSGSSVGNLGTIGILLSVGVPLLLFLLRMVSARRTSPLSVRQTRAPGSGLRIFLTGLLPIVITIAAIFLLSMLVSRSGIDIGKPNGLSILLFVVLAFLLFLIGIVLSVGGVRYAIESKGLLAPMANAKLLLKDRALTGMLFLNVLLLAALTLLTSTVGLVLFVLPGLFVFVICSLAFWYLFAHYGRKVGIHKPDFTLTKSTPPVV